MWYNTHTGDLLTRYSELPLRNVADNSDCLKLQKKKKKKITSFGQPTSLIARGRPCQTSFICVKLNADAQAFARANHSIHDFGDP